MSEATVTSKPVRFPETRPQAAPSATSRPLMSLLVILESLRQSQVLTTSLKR